MSYLDIFRLLLYTKDNWRIKECDRVARVPGQLMNSV